MLQLQGVTYTQTVLTNPFWHKQLSSNLTSHQLFSCQDTPYWYPSTSPELHMTSTAWELAKLHLPNPQSLLEQICWHRACARGQEHLKSHPFFGSLKPFCCPVSPLPFSLICERFFSMEHFTEAGSTQGSTLRSSHEPHWCWFIFWCCHPASNAYLPRFWHKTFPT